MSRSIEFIITVEVEDGESIAELEETIEEMEDMCIIRGYGVHDVCIKEDGEVLTDSVNKEPAEEGYDGVLGEG